MPYYTRIKLVLFSCAQYVSVSFVVDGRNIIWKEYVVIIYPNLASEIVTKKAQLWTGMLLWSIYVYAISRIKTKQHYDQYVHFIAPLYINSLAMDILLYFTHRNVQNVPVASYNLAIWKVGYSKQPFWKSNVPIMVPRILSPSSMDYILKTILSCFVDSFNVVSARKIHRFLGPWNTILNTRIVKISHADQKIWNKVDCLIFWGGHFEKIPIWPPTGVDSSGHRF